MPRPILVLLDASFIHHLDSQNDYKLETDSEYSTLLCVISKSAPDV